MPNDFHFSAGVLRGSATVATAWTVLRGGLRGLGVQDRHSFVRWMVEQGLPEVRPGAYLTRTAQEVALASAAGQDEHV
eukprot:4965854-Karenia_brevis.AAC.1